MGEEDEWKGRGLQRLVAAPAHRSGELPASRDQ